MLVIRSPNDAYLIGELLRRGAVGVMPSDTVLGVFGRAERATVQRIYRLRRRDPRKPLIVLISSLAQLKRFGAAVSPRRKRILARVWPGPVTVILPVAPRAWEFISRGSGGIAFRMPSNAALRTVIRRAGPLVAPSANTEGSPPAVNLREAFGYFRNGVDFYVLGSPKTKKSSTLVSLLGDAPEVLRRGAGYEKVRDIL